MSEEYTGPARPWPCRYCKAGPGEPCHHAAGNPRHGEQTPMTDIQQRIADMLRDHLKWPGTACRCGHNVCGDGGAHERNIRYASHIAEVLVSALDLREVSNSGRLDDLGFLHMVWDLDVEPQRYVQYISGWHEA